MEYPSPPPNYIDSRYRQPQNRRTSTSPHYSGRMAHPEEQYDHSTGNSRSWLPQQASNNYPSNPAYPSQTRESDSSMGYQQAPAYPSPFTQGTGNNQYQPAPGYTSTFGQGMGNNEYQPLPAYPSSIRQGDGSGDYHQVPANPSQTTESGSSSDDQPPAYISPARASDSSNNSQLLPVPAPTTWNSGLQSCGYFCQVEYIIFVNTHEENLRSPINGGPAPYEFTSRLVATRRTYQCYGPFRERPST